LPPKRDIDFSIDLMPVVSPVSKTPWKIGTPERMRIVHKIQEVEIVEYMGGRMPRIYASLHNNQTNYQSPMIEVEGNIDNQPISILLEIFIVT
jgi:hypothetical protein